MTRSSKNLPLTVSVNRYYGGRYERTRRIGLFRRCWNWITGKKAKSSLVYYDITSAYPKEFITFTRSDVESLQTGLDIIQECERRQFEEKK